MTETATFTIALSKRSTAATTVHYATADGTAIAGTHYTATAGTATIAAGQISTTVAVPVVEPAPNAPSRRFTMMLTAPNGALIGGPLGTCIIPAGAGATEYLDRFAWIYAAVKNTANGYFGPPTGAKAFTVPYHSVQKLIVEGPDWGHTSASETASFWARLEAWKIGLTGDAIGYAAAWASIDQNYVPSATLQPWGAYNPASPATYQPEADTTSGYPTAPDTTFPVGADPLAVPLAATYGTKLVYLMHWFFDTDGVYGFHNGDGSGQVVAINSYQRGLSEGVWDAIPQGEWEDWHNGGGPHGYLPIFGQSTPEYPSAPFPYAKQWRYTSAPDAEGRAIAAAFTAHQFASAAGVSVAAQDTLAKKMGDYLRYALYDKYFKPIPGYDGSGCHYLVSWYASWGGEIPAGAPSSFGFRIGSSESHHGYNNVDAAHAMATSGAGYSPVTSGAAAQWQTSLARQIELIRWLQSPEGPIAGGVSNSWNGRYETPTDGRQTAKFYGLYYTYSPVWHDPPSNNWFGFQAWGLERVAALYLRTAALSDSFNANLRANCAVILDRWVNWLLDHASVAGGVISLPLNLRWVSATAVGGQTATAPNHEGVYEYLPTLNWDSTGSYSAFWNASSVPNPNLHCAITDMGLDLGPAAATSQLLIQYAQAKRAAGGALANTITGGAHTVQQALDLAKGILDAIWTSNKGTIGFSAAEARSDYSRFNDPVYLPSIFSGTTPTGDAMTPGVSTFISIRSWMKSDSAWPAVQAYLDGGAVPVFHYNRFWNQCDCAVGFGMLHHYFADVIYP